MTVKLNQLQRDRLAAVVLKCPEPWQWCRQWEANMHKATMRALETRGLIETRERLARSSFFECRPTPAGRRAVAP